MIRRDFSAIAIAAAFACNACAHVPPPDLASFEAALAAQDSATAALTGWCSSQDIAKPPVIQARNIADASQLIPQEIRRILAVGEDDTLGYRHVLLTCGDTVLSDAHNWFVPSRLTREMNETLTTTTEPFGKVVAPLGFIRERLSSQHGPAAGCPDDTILSHRAVLRLPDGRAISLVQECYTPANLPSRR